MKSPVRRKLLFSTIGIGTTALAKSDGTRVGGQGHPRSHAESIAGVTPIDYGYPPGDVRRFGADPSGVIDSRNAFADASKIGVPIAIAPGIYNIHSDVTLSPIVIFNPGAMLRPANGVTITFSTLTSYIQAGPYQIFDLALGGSVSIPQCNTVCPAEWWGAKGDLKKLDNEIPINQALLAVASLTTAVSGGEVTLERGLFFISGTINLRPNTWLRGKGKLYSVIKPGVPFRQDSYMVVAKDEARPMFNCPIVDLRLDANNDPNIQAVIYAPAWQQKSGTQNVYISNFKRIGIQLDTGYGGAAQLTIRQTEIYTSSDPLTSAACISADYSQSVVGWIDITLQEVDFGCAQATFNFTSNVPSGATSATLASEWPYESGVWDILFSTGEARIATMTKKQTAVTWDAGLARRQTMSANAVSPNAVGMRATGRVVVICLDVHSEFIQSVFLLEREATVSGSAIKCDGNNSVQALFKLAHEWTGNINATSVKQGGATKLIIDSSRPYPLANQVPYDNQLIWPPNPARAFATANVVGGGAPVLKHHIGVAHVSHIAVGTQRLTLLPAAFDISSYDVIATSADPSAPILCVSKLSESVFDVLTMSAAGRPENAAEFAVKVYHRS
jgi:hypothetical protein